MPGKTFSNHFLNSWSYLLSYCLNHNITPYIITKTNSNVYYVRNQCLGADLTRGPDQNPWNGELDYDFIMWIDSDQVFKVEDDHGIFATRCDQLTGNCEYVHWEWDRQNNQQQVCTGAKLYLMAYPLHSFGIINYENKYLFISSYCKYL